MKFFSRKNLLKILLIIPVALIVNIDCFLSEVGSVETPVEDYFRSFFTGRVTHGDISTIVFAMENITYLFVFLVLFGSFISGRLSFVPSYYFIRVKNRSRWFLCECAKLSAFSALYSLLYCVVVLIISLVLTAQDINICLIQVFLFYFFVSQTLLIIFSILLNLLSMKFGAPIGFAIDCVIILLLCITAIKSANEAALFFNPMSYNGTADADFGLQIKGIIYNYFLVALVCICGCKYFEHREIR